MNSTAEVTTIQRKKLMAISEEISWLAHHLLTCPKEHLKTVKRLLLKSQKEKNALVSLLEKKNSRPRVPTASSRCTSTQPRTKKTTTGGPASSVGTQNDSK